MISGASTARFIIAVLLYGATLTYAESFSVEQLMQSLALVKTARANFVEKKFLAIVDRPVESGGKLIYVAPNRLEKYTLRPRAETMILDRDELSIEDLGRHKIRKLSLQEYPVLRAFVESIRATLAGDYAALNRFYATNLSGTRDRWTLVLVPRDPETQRLVRAIHISGATDRIQSVEVQQNDGDRSLMTLSEDH